MVHRSKHGLYSARVSEDSGRTFHCVCYYWVALFKLDLYVHIYVEKMELCINGKYS